jgi:L-amino acid N-acyltransferase YncA
MTVALFPQLPHLTNQVRRSQTAAPEEEMLIRDATEADLPGIIEIFNATIPSRMVSATLAPVSVEERLPWFLAHSGDHYPLWVVCEKKQVMAWLSLQSFLPRCAYEGTAEVSVYVHEGFRRRGVGKSLLAEAVRRGPALGLTALVGHVFAHNEPSLRLFARAGFERWGLLPRVARLEGVERDLVIVGRHVA